MANCSYGAIYHRIAPGDSIWTIANRYGTTMDEIIELNPGVNAYNLTVGATLMVCPNMPNVVPENNMSRQNAMPSWMPWDEFLG